MARRLPGLCLLLALVVVGAAPPPGTGVAPTLSLDGYRQSLSRALTTLQRARHESDAARRRDLRAARRDLPPLVVVRNGTLVVAVDLRPIRAALDHNDPGTAIVRLTALHSALEVDTHASTLPSTGMGELDRLLSGPPFITPPTVWQRLGDLVVTHTPLGALLAALNRLLGALSAASGSGPLLPIVGGVIVAAALLFMLTRLFGRLTLPTTPVADDDDEALLPRGLDAAAARATAAARAGVGDYRQAARYLYLATVLALAESGYLQLDGATSNRDLLGQAAARPPLAEALAPLVRTFEAVWFGHHTLSPEDYTQYHRLTERALESTR